MTHTNTYSQMVFEEVAKIIQWRNNSLFNKLCWKNWPSLLSTCYMSSTKFSSHAAPSFICITCCEVRVIPTSSAQIGTLRLSNVPEGTMC